MNYDGYSVPRPPIPARPIPWLTFLFLAATLFFVYHDLSYSRGGIGNYDAAEDAIVGVVAEGSSSRRIALVSLAIFAIISLIRSRTEGRIRARGAVGWLLLGFVAWAVASPVWAEDRVLTLTRVAVFGILCLAAVAIVRRFTLREIILWALFSSAAYVVVGILVELMFGAFQPLASGYRFAGTLHPNSQGINCAVLLLSAVAAAKVERRGLTFLRICAFVGFVFLVLTASRTAFASVLLALSVYFAVVYSRRAKLAMAYALSILLCILVLSLGNAFLPDVKSAVNLGRVDSTEGTFNGRTGIWDAIGHYVVQRPILGYGFGGFWTPAHIRAISEEEKWGIPNSHSAYLDYLLTLGSVGVAAYALLLFAGIWRALRFQKLSRNTALAFCWMLLVFCAMDGFLESAAANPSLPMLLSLVVLIFLAGMNDAQASRFHDPSRRIPILDRLA